MSLIQSLPPNAANPTMFGPPSTLAHVQQGLADLPPGADLSKPFDWRKNGPYNKGFNLIPPYNQANCGNCWAMSSTNALADKFIIFKGLQGIKLDPLLTTICTKPPVWNHECGGGSPFIAAKYFEDVGASQSGEGCESWDEFCVQNNSCGPGQRRMPTLPRCGTLTCKQNYRAAKGSTRSLSVVVNGRVDPEKTITNIKTAIANHGPCVAVYQVFLDFQMGSGDILIPGYKWDDTNGIYIQGSYNDTIAKAWKEQGRQGPIPNGNKPEGYHAVEIVGWSSGIVKGEETSYWIVKNSWGEKWNGDGYFKMAMYPHNQNTFFDIPKQADQYSSHGGCIDFAIDPSSGGKRGTKVGPYKTGGTSGLTRMESALLLLVVIAFAIGVYYVYLRRNKYR